MSNQFFDLKFERLPSGNIRLKQSAFDEDSTIDLHPVQLEHLARALLGFCDAERVRNLERRIAVLTDKIQDFACASYMRDDLLKRCADGLEYLIRLDAIVDLALEFDGGRLTPEEPPEEHGQGSSEPSVMSDQTEQKKATRLTPMAPPKTGQQLGLAV